MLEPLDSDSLHTRSPWTIMTVTGRMLDPFLMEPGDVTLEDIAKALSHQCRFNGHTAGMLTVARHSINCAKFAKSDGCDREVQLALLLHDAAEAYIGDMVRPIKHRPEFQAFRDLDAALTAKVFERYGISVEAAGRVHEYDQIVTKVEASYGRWQYKGDSLADYQEYLELFGGLVEDAVLTGDEKELLRK